MDIYFHVLPGMHEEAMGNAMTCSQGSHKGLLLYHLNKKRGSS